MLPKVSIVMATHNGIKYLEQSVSSILSQKFDNFEFIIVDDGSTDNTLSELKKINDSRVRIIHQNNQGQTNALIKGVENTCGDLIARIDQDDYSLPNRLMRQVEFMDTHPKVILCGSRFQELHNDKIAPQRARFARTNTEIKKIISRLNPFAHSAVMFRRDAYFKIGGYNKNFVVGMDYDLFLRLMEIGEVYNIEEVLTIVRVYDDSISMRQSKLKTLEGMKIRCHAYSKFGGNPLLTGFFFLKSMLGLVLPRWLKTPFY